MKITTYSLSVLCAGLLLITCQPAPPSEQNAELEQLVDELCQPPQQGLAPGTAIAVVKDGQVLINKGYGYANLEEEIPITSDARFDMASVSKQFAGYAISRLIEEGDIAITDDIRDYIPELPAFGETITIDHLVHHTSGIRDWASTLPLTGRSFEDVISYEHILRMAYDQQALNFPPGAEYSYTNTGYNLLAELVARVSGMTFREWTDENIFSPLDMERTFFLDNHREVIPGRVQGYFERAGEFQASSNLLTALGSSSMYSASTDMVKWVNFLQEGIKGGDPVITRMLTQGVLNDGQEIAYAYGLSVSDFRGTRWINHSGSWASFRTYVALLPEYDLSVVVMSNYPRNVAAVAREVAALFVPESGGEEAGQEVAAEDADRVSVATSLLDAYAGSYKLGDAWYVHITRGDSGLSVQATDESEFPMVALSDSVFLVPDYGNRTITFSRDGQSVVTHLVYMDEVRPKLLGSFEFDLSAAEAYKGQYYSEELDTQMTIDLEGDELKIWHFEYGSIDLTPAWVDDFRGGQWWVQAVVFERDEQGRVAGFRVSTGRSRNQWFAKVAWE